MVTNSQTNNKDEAQAIGALDLELMSKYNQLLSVLITDVNAEPNLRLPLMAHAIVINRHIQKLSTKYPEDSIYEFYKALVNLKLAIPSTKDATLRELLQENLDQIKAFFIRIESYLKPRLPHLEAVSKLSKGNDEQLPLHQRLVNPSLAYADTNEMVKGIVRSKNNVRAETSDNMKTIADALKASYGNNNQDQVYSTALDELFVIGYKNLQERKEWSKQFPTQFSDQQQTRKDRTKSVNEKLNFIADVFLAEQKKKEQR